MTDCDRFRTLFDYNHWATEKILARVALLTDEQYRAQVPGLSMGSIHGVLSHCLAAEVVWLARCQGMSPSTIPSERDFPDLQALKERWHEQDAAQGAFLASLCEGDLDRSVTYWTTAGQKCTNPLWQLLTHVVNHSTQCRSEVAVALTKFGQSPGDLDLILYLRELAAS